MKAIKSWWATVAQNEKAGLITLSVFFGAVMLFAIGIQMGRVIVYFS